MNGHFDVRFFKRLITFTVVGIIVVLSIVVILLSMKLERQQQNTVGGAEEVQSAVQFIEKSYAGDSFDYQKLYSDMKVKRKNTVISQNKKVVYLTFDDGPSAENTDKVLNILKRYKVKATFFVVHSDCRNMKNILKREIAEGHSVGIHTYSHNYEKIYASEKAYLDDFYSMWSYLKRNFNYESTVFRFPGGSLNGYNLDICDSIAPEMYRRGFRFFDWNASAEDATNKVLSKGTIANNIIKQVERNNGPSVVLMHDSAGKESTIAALPKVINTLRAKGYVFKTLDNSVKPLTFM